jgi:HEPN domain-containing protein
MDRIIVDEWMKYADSDLAVATILSSHRPLQVEIICFHCQQAAEKALKAYLLSIDHEPPKAKPC